MLALRAPGPGAPDKRRNSAAHPKHGQLGSTAVCGLLEVPLAPDFGKIVKKMPLVQNHPQWRPGRLWLWSRQWRRMQLCSCQEASDALADTRLGLGQKTFPGAPPGCFSCRSSGLVQMPQLRV